jgi:ankyrin repeat protein
MHLLQIQNPQGLLSNEFIFHVIDASNQVGEKKRQKELAYAAIRNALGDAISKGDLETTKKILGKGRQINARRPDGGSTPLSNAALYGHLDIVNFLIERGAYVEATNEDGNTPLHVAAFLCRTEIVKTLLENGSMPTTKNKRGESPIDIVSGEWNQGLSDFYLGLSQALQLNIDLPKMKVERSKIADILRDADKE